MAHLCIPARDETEMNRRDDHAMNFLQRQWEEIRPNLKWQIVLAIGGWIGGTGGVATLLAWATKYLQVLIGVPVLPTRFYVVFAIFIFCALVVSITFVFVFMGFTRRQPISASPTVAVLPPVTPAATPKPVDLQGEILELYFGQSKGKHKLVLMKIRIVNHGLDEASIINWRLKITVGDDPPFVVLPINIPSVWRIGRPKPGSSFQDSEYYNEKSIDVRLNELPATDTYRRGVPREGWIAFEDHFFDLEFPNGRFDVLLKDSFGGEHSIHRPATVYRRDKELITTEPVQGKP